MEVFSNIVLNLQAPAFATVFSPQGQTLSRSIQATLMDGATPWEIPETALCIIRYAKPDGTKGFYDTLEDDSSAYSYNGNVVTFGLATQALTVPGTVLMQLDFYNSDGEKLSTFTFRLIVAEGVFADSDIASEDFINVLTAKLTEAAKVFADGEAEAQQFFDENTAEAQQIFDQIKQVYGAPWTAATAAAMTDTSRVYVYTGTTTDTLTNGHWYYWDGTAWADGGVYNSTAFETDPTLTIAGAAADAKATGDAVEDLNRQISDVEENQIPEITGNRQIEFTVGGYYNTQNATVDLTADPTPNANYKYAVIDCAAGDLFTISGEGGNASRLYAFVDSSSPANVLVRSVGNQIADELLIAAPTNASKLVINSKALTKNCYIGNIVKNQLSTIPALAGIIVNNLNQSAYIENKIINADGTETASPNYLITDFIPVAQHGKIIFAGSLAGINDGYYNIHAYDANHNWISGVYRQESSSMKVEITLTLPEDCAYIKIMTSSAGNYKVFLLYYNIDGTVIELSDAIKVVDNFSANEIEKINKKAYTSLALFENIAVCGDSWGCGYVAVDSSRHDGISWIKIMARQNGVNGFIYAAPGYNTATWLSGQHGLTKLLNETAKNLYFIVLGINPEPEDTTPPSGANLGSIADCNADYTQNANTFYGRYGRIIGNIKDHAPNAKIVCIIPVLRYNTTAAAIPQIAEFYGVPWFDAKSSDYFNTDFYTNNRQSAHPLAITYAGIANAFESLLIDKIVESPTYWKDYTGND